MKKEKLLDKISREELLNLKNGGMSAREIAEMYGCSEQTVYNNLKGMLHGKGGRVAKRIPKHEICKEQEMQIMAEQNAENACVMLEGCSVNLVGNVGKYRVNPTEGRVHVIVEIKGDRPYIPMHNEGINISIKDIPELIEELKGVCRCAKSFEMGNVMW